VALWRRTGNAAELHARLVAAGVEVAGPVQDSPFGPTFTFTGPEGYRLTVHGS
jgi:predicted enzyme related to lactoylglutathione lyase